MAEAIKLELVQVPPPKVTPVDPVASELGLPPGLRAAKADRPFRCSGCHKLTGSGWQVWVPDGIRRGDDPGAISETCRLSAYNGMFSGWCLPCAQSLSRPRQNFIPSSSLDSSSVGAIVLMAVTVIVVGGLALTIFLMRLA